MLSVATITVATCCISLGRQRAKENASERKAMMLQRPTLRDADEYAGLSNSCAVAAAAAAAVTGSSESLIFSRGARVNAGKVATDVSVAAF